MATGRESQTKEKKGEIPLEKQLMQAEIEKEFQGNSHVFFSRFERLTVQEMSELRRSLEKVSRRTLVVKHTLTKKILEKMELSEASKFLEGSVLVTLGDGEPQTISKALADFAKAHEGLRLKGMIFEGKVYGDDRVKELAQLPSRHELLALVATGLKSPLARLAGGLRGVLQSLVIVLSEVQKKKTQS